MPRFSPQKHTTWLRESGWCRLVLWHTHNRHTHTHITTTRKNTGINKPTVKHTQHCTPQEYHLMLSLQLSSSFVPKLVPKDDFIFKLHCFEPSCRLAWEPSMLNLTYHWSVCIIFRCCLLATEHQWTGTWLICVQGKRDDQYKAIEAPDRWKAKGVTMQRPPPSTLPSLHGVRAVR